MFCGVWCARGQNKHACVVDFDAVAVRCAAGYEGPICGSCAPGFGVSSDNLCDECPSAGECAREALRWRRVGSPRRLPRCVAFLQASRGS